jgi:hypothetical protein
MIQYFGNSAYEAYQRNGQLFDNSLATQTQQEIAEEQNPVNAEVNAEETATNVEGAEVEASFIKVGDNVADMFTDAEWNQMYEQFKKDNPELNREEYAGFTMKEFKQLMIDGMDDSQNVNILNDLAKRIGRGEKMKTIDESGKEIDVC